MVDHILFCYLLDVFTMKWVKFSVELLYPQLDGNMLSLLNSSLAGNLGGKTFLQEELFTNWCLIKFLPHENSLLYGTQNIYWTHHS